MKRRLNSALSILMCRVSHVVTTGSPNLVGVVSVEAGKINWTNRTCRAEVLHVRHDHINTIE